MFHRLLHAQQKQLQNPNTLEKPENVDSFWNLWGPPQFKMWPHCLHSDLPTEWPLFRSASIHPPSIQTCLLYGNISWISYPGVTLPAAAAAAAAAASAAPKGSQTVQQRHKNVSGAQTAMIGPWQPHRRRLSPQLLCTFFSKCDSWWSRTCVSEPCCTISRVETCLHFSFGYFTSPPGESKTFTFFAFWFCRQFRSVMFVIDGVALWLWSLTWRRRRVDVYKEFLRAKTLMSLRFLWGL